ncbi:3-dehydroquinate synthase [bacterium]|nr:3-dehydroquinate synthase [bacterium]
MDINVDGSSGYEVRFLPSDSTWDGIDRSGVVITDSNLHSIYRESISTERLVVIGAGEASKSPEVYLSVVDQVLSLGLKRNGVIWAFGGGVVGDLAGFVAATVHRGVDFVQVPTSLLAMVDSSVGGKVGIDLRHGKNLLGAFHNPKEVRLSIDLLKTLPPEHFTNGMAEVIKYGWIWDVELLDNLKSERLSIESTDLQEVVARCISIKRDVVEADFEEKSGARAILNFGHTVGHALETLDGYSNLLHGEAIAIGMVAEAAIAYRAGISEIDPFDVAEIFDLYDLPVRPKSEIELSRLIELMTGDKKNIGDGLSLSLVTVPGECKLCHGVEPDMVQSVLADLWT